MKCKNKTKQKTKNSHLEPYNHLQRVETKAQIFYVMPKKMQKNKTKKKRENGSFLRTRKHVQIESKLIQVIVKKKKENKKRKDQYDLNFNIKF